jgi:GDP-4-dehydro-6-deoxy-D-mannose reductase
MPTWIETEGATDSRWHSIMRILITGVTGFAGSYLAEALCERPGVELFGLGRTGWKDDQKALARRVTLEVCDLNDQPRLDAALARIKAEQIYHLAGYSHAGKSAREADAAWTGNLTATRNLYAAAERSGQRPRILFVGSGLVYENSDSPEHAHSESCPLEPTTPYAASKSAADLASYQSAHSGALDIVRVRPFNHVGPRQSSEYAVASFARQIAAVEREERPSVVETGNLSPLRDLTDVRDVVRAYILVMERGRSGDVYNVASGVARSMQSVLDGLLALSRVRITQRTNQELVRGADSPVVRGDAGKLRRETGWAPHFSFEQTLADTLECWRRRT